MGIWSYPLFVFPSKLKGCGSEISDIDIGQLYHCLEIPKEEFDVDKLHQSIYGCSKIWGYLLGREKKAWKAYLDHISEKCKVNTILMFFYCHDYDFPYVIGLFNGKFEIRYFKSNEPIWTDGEIKENDFSNDFNQKIFEKIFNNKNINMKLLINSTSKVENGPW